MHSIEHLKTVFYEQDGVLYWKVHRRKTPPGSIAGNVNKAGYVDVRYDGIRYYAHRIIFAFYHNRWPQGFIDHIDKNKNNNHINNLREANFTQNSCNTRRRIDNKSGVKGVSKHGKGWVAEISYKSKRHRKYFTTKQKATLWITDLRQTLHKEFASY